MKKLKLSVKELSPYWEEYKKLHLKFSNDLNKIEKKMQVKFKNKNISFFWCDGEINGIGTYPYSEQMDLIHDIELNGDKK